MQPLSSDSKAVYGNNENSASETAQRDIANAISNAQNLHPKEKGEDIDAITDPDEYRLRHPFGGMKMNANQLAKTLNGWEENNSMMYKLEQERFIHHKAEAMREQRQKMLEQQREKDRKKAESLVQATKAKEEAKKPLIESKSVKNIVTKYLGEHAVNNVKEHTKTAAEKAEEEVLNYNGRKNIVQHPANKAPLRPTLF